LIFFDRVPELPLLIPSKARDAMRRIWADERAVRQVTLNLRSNAARRRDHYQGRWTRRADYTSPSPTQGPAFPPKKSRSSCRLSAAGRSRRKTRRGTGLGLPIVKGLVELQGGEFRLNSTVRLGTEVIVIFPSERVMDTLPAGFHPSSPSRDKA
jgi:two-component system cell cycle sensor histidine kinase PleC